MIHVHVYTARRRRPARRRSLVPCRKRAAQGSSTDVLGETVQPKMPADDLQLYYWNGRGLLEVGRMVLAAAGKKAGIDYA